MDCGGLCPADEIKILEKLVFLCEFKSKSQEWVVVGSTQQIKYKSLNRIVWFGFFSCEFKSKSQEWVVVGCAQQELNPRPDWPLGVVTV